VGTLVGEESIYEEQNHLNPPVIIGTVDDSSNPAGSGSQSTAMVTDTESSTALADQHADSALEVPPSTESTVSGLNDRLSMPLLHYGSSPTILTILFCSIIPAPL
jgi:hypothetical protein